MPSVSVPLNGTDQTVTRTVTLDVVRKLQEITGIDLASKIIFPGITEKMQQPGSSIDDGDRSAQLLDERSLQVSCVEEVDMDSISFINRMARIENQPIFIDAETGVEIKPVYVKTNLKISVRYRTHSLTEIRRWRDSIYSRYAEGKDINYHDITFSYMVPNPYIELLTVIHSLWKSDTPPYTQNFDNYFKHRCTNSMTSIANPSGTQQDIVVTETRTRLIGSFEFVGVPDPYEKDGQSNGFLINFNYNICYSKPTMMVMKYPVVINNKMLPSRYVVFNNNTPDPNKIPNQIRSVSMQALKHLEGGGPDDLVNQSNQVMTVPRGDEFILNMTTIHGIAPLMTVLCLVDSDGLGLLNLNQIPNVSINQDILDFLSQSEYQYVCDSYQSVYNITHYVGGFPTKTYGLTCDANLNIKATIPLNLRVQNRIVFSVVTDLTLLSVNSIERLKTYPKAFVNTILAINRAFSSFAAFSSLGKASKITEANFNTVYKLLTTTSVDHLQLMDTTTPASGSLNSSGTYVYSTPPVGNLTPRTVLVAFDYNSSNIFTQLTASSMARLINQVNGFAKTVSVSYILVGNN